MDFFAHQEQARKHTGLLVGLFILATVLIGVGMHLVVAGALDIGFSSSDSHRHGQHATYDDQGYTTGSNNASPDQQPRTPALWLYYLNPKLMLLTLGGTWLLIGLSSLFKSMSLRHGGGKHIAQAMGAMQVHRDTTDPSERRLINVVEEMALACGTPMPAVYVMPEESAINAFAAGFSTNDAVIAVTRGCMTRLSRDELQGVVAHEFSHILNGDMKLNLRLIGILFGVMVMGIIGFQVFRIFLYSSAGRSKSRDKGGGVLLVIVLLALAMWIIGYIGLFVGRLIKAAISRQREYLADASAVQFTRNPAGIAGALKKIGGFTTGSKLSNSHSEEYSHLFFCQGLSSILATHPPLPERIRRIEPQWHGRMQSSHEMTGEEIEHETTCGLSSSAAQAQSAEPAVDANALSTSRLVDLWLGDIGQPSPLHVRHARHLLSMIPQTLQKACRHPATARAVVLAMLIDNDTTVRDQQWHILKQHVQTDLLTQINQYLTPLDALDDALWLPLLDLAVAALTELSQTQYVTFRRMVRALTSADGKVSPFEWMLEKALARRLDPRYFGHKRSSGRTRVQSTAIPMHLARVIDLIARCSGDDGTEPANAFNAACTEWGDDTLSPPTAPADLKQIEQAIAALACLPAADKRRVIRACAAAVLCDGQANLREVELFRMIADAMDVPIPPILPGRLRAKSD